MDISVIIPARQERFLDKTILDLQLKLRGSHEIIVVLDGKWEEPLPGVRYIYNKDVKGMRTAINQAVAEAQGTYIMKIDAHCMVDEGIDEKLIAVHQENWVQAPRRKRLDPRKWKLIEEEKPDVDYMYIGSNYRGYKDHVKNGNLELKNKFIDDTDIFQGSCYFMTKAYFQKLGLLDDKNFGKMGSEALEIVLKCKKDGGRVIINKTTWYAHAHIGALYSGRSLERQKSREYVRTFVTL